MTAVHREVDCREPRVLLICPPFQSPKLGSIAVVRLAGHLRRHDVLCAEAYLNLDFCTIIGMDRYEIINDTKDGRGNGQTAELLFAEGLHGEVDDPVLQTSIERLFGDRAARRAVLDAFEARVQSRIEAEAPTLIGITTSFNQLLAALWMTDVIKRTRPDIPVVIGGTACKMPMGKTIARAYPKVDCVVTGYGEGPLLRLARGERPADRVFEVRTPPRLEQHPVPEYRHFLRELAAFDPTLCPTLMFQSSKGCWWGERRHCTFCGLDAGVAAFHAQSSARALDDIRTLWERHGLELMATDCIMARDHLRTLLPGLARFQERPKVFYEMKANLSESDVIAMACADVSGQLGIESLSSRLLKLMKKGLTAIRALAVLKWAREQGVNVVWNQLCGVPGERVEDYDSQIELMARIPHLKPPHRVNPVVIDRYSPYFDDHRTFGWKRLRPIAQCRAAHPTLDGDTLKDIAYHFEGEGGVTTDAYLDRFEAAVSAWKARYERGDGLFWHRFDGLIRIEDGVETALSVGDSARRVIEATHRIVPITRVIETAGCDASLVDEMIGHGLLYREKGNLINLTVRHS